MTCPMCTERVKDWEGSDPKCAFPHGVFAADNWNCATMNWLRELSGERSILQAMMEGPKDGPRGFWWRDDQGPASISVVVAVNGYVVMSYYKSRGKVGQAYWFSDDDTPRPLTLSDLDDLMMEEKRRSNET